MTLCARRELAGLHRAVMRLARGCPVCRQLMTAPGVGVVVALTFKSTIDEPARFARSRDIGPDLGLVPRRHQSGETGYVGSITRIGDVMLRTALDEAATTILRMNGAAVHRRSALQAWARRRAERAGARTARQGRAFDAARAASIRSRGPDRRRCRRWPASSAPSCTRCGPAAGSVFRSEAAAAIQVPRSVELADRHQPASKRADGPGRGTRSGPGRSAASAPSAPSALARWADPFPNQPHDVAVVDGRPRTEARSSGLGPTWQQTAKLMEIAMSP